MAIYLGDSGKLIINIDNNAYRLIIYSPPITTTDTMLLSFDNYILKDFNGAYLIAKEDE